MTISHRDRPSRCAEVLVQIPLLVPVVVVALESPANVKGYGLNQQGKYKVRLFFCNVSVKVAKQSEFSMVIGYLPNYRD